MVLDGYAHPLLHVSQIAELLGLDALVAGSPARDGAGPPAGDGAGALAILEAWLEHVRDADWDALLQPTLSRGRTLRNLTVNVFHPFELLPDAWTSSEFPWRPEEDGVRELLHTTRPALLAWAEGAATGWRLFIGREDLDARDPVVTSPRGATRFSALVSFQRRHAAYHYRQLVHVLGAADDGLLDGLDLPREVF